MDRALAPQPGPAPAPALRPTRWPVLRTVMLGVIGAGLLTLAYGGCLQHDVRLWRMRWRFTAVAHPPGSTRLDSASALGLLSGNGNHCDYFVGELRSSKLPGRTIEAFYAGQRLPAGADNLPEALDLHFLPEEDRHGYLPDGWREKR